jgi:hypothetical protein
MPQYKLYPTAATTPNRKQRKAQRRTIFWQNKAQAAAEKRARKEAKGGTK